MKTIKVKEIYTIMSSTNMQPVLSIDGAPGSYDDSMLIFFNEHDAQCSLDHHVDMYDYDDLIIVKLEIGDE